VAFRTCILSSYDTIVTPNEDDPFNTGSAQVGVSGACHVAMEASTSGGCCGRWQAGLGELPGPVPPWWWARMCAVHCLLASAGCQASHIAAMNSTFFPAGPTVPCISGICRHTPPSL
jgi:hypothetical protein